MSRKAEKKIEKDTGRPSKQKRLLVQVGLIFGIFFTLIILITSVLVVKGNMSTYLEAKEEMLNPVLLRVRNRLISIPAYDWYLDYWESHTEIKKGEIEDLYDLLEKNGISTEDDNINLTREQLEALPSDVQYAVAKLVYYNVSVEMNLAQWQLNNEQLYCMDISDENPGFLFFKADINENDVAENNWADIFFSIGLKMDLSGHDAIQKMKSPKFEKNFKVTIYERYDNPKNGEYYYNGYSPIMVDGKVRCVIAITHQWSEFHSTMIKQLLIMTVISALVIFIPGAVLLYYINRAAISPLRRVQEGVQNYMLSKDSEGVVRDMAVIRQKNEIGALAQDVSSLALEMDRYTAENSRLTGERERVATELSLAAAIQNGALNTNFPSEKDYDLYATMTPAKEVGGDFYDFFPIDDTHLGLVIGDVSGKGVPASLYMMMAQLLIRQYARAGHSPAETFMRTNQDLCENNKLEMFVTAWFGILDRTTGKIVATSAGHEFPILKGAEGDFALYKDRHGFVLAGMEMSKYREYEFTLEPGGTLLVYTDGAPEATSAAEELFGTDRMLEALNRNLDAGPKELTDALREAINQFVGEAPQFDDLTMLCIRYHGMPNAGNADEAVNES